MFQASAIWNTQNKPSASPEKAQYKPPHSSYPHSSRSENGETSDKKAQKEKKKRRPLEHKRAQNVSGSVVIGSTQCRDADQRPVCGGYG